MKQKVKKKKLTKDEFKRILNTPRREKLTKGQLDRLKVREFIEIYADFDHKENIILADGLDKAFLGLAYRDGEHGAQVAVYGIFSCIHQLQLDNKWSWMKLKNTSTSIPAGLMLASIPRCSSRRWCDDRPKL
jgi:hypothetical protein